MVSVPRDAPEVDKLINGHTSDPSLKVNGDTGKKTSPTFVSGKFSIDEPRPIKVVVIGAGYSGIIAGIRCVHNRRMQDTHDDIVAGFLRRSKTWT